MAPSPSPAAAQETIGQRLRRLRTERGLSQRELSSPGVSYAYISRIEAGTRQPSVKALRKLARKLGVSPEYLETGSEIGDAERREMRLVDAELELRLADDAEAAARKLREVLAEAVEAGDTPSATRARLALGSAALDGGDPREAVDLLEAAIRDGDLGPSSAPEAYADLGHAYAALGDTKRAIELYEECLERARRDEPENAAAIVQYATHLSYALSDVGDLERAQGVLQEVLESSESLSDPYMRVKLYWSVARLCTMRGEAAAGLRYARRAIALLEATENTVQLGRAHLLCGGITLRRGRADEASYHLELAERLLGPHPPPRDLAYLRTEQARQAVLQRRGAEAAGLARQALELLGDTDPGERGAAWLALAEGLALADELPAAVEAFRRAVSCLERAGHANETAQAYRAWAHALRDAGREAEALDVLERAADLAVQAPAEDRLRA